MPSFKQPTFEERTALAAKAKTAALEKLRAKPPIDDAVIAQRREAAFVREAAQAKVREERLAARALEKQQKSERIAQQAAAVSEPVRAKTEEEMKIVRDAKYAARKNRLGKR